DPTDSSGLTSLAWMAHAEGRDEEAAALCARAEKIEPSHPMNRCVWGLVQLKLSRWPDAEKHFREALRSNPTHAGANQGLSEALRHQGQAAKRARFARRPAPWTDPPPPEMLPTLADAYTAAERIADARQTLEKALFIAQANNSPLAAEIRNRLGRH